MTTAVKTSEISVARAAQIIRCSEDTVRRLIESGDLEAYRLTARGHWRVDRDSVTRYLTRLQNNRP